MPGGINDPSYGKYSKKFSSVPISNSLISFTDPWRFKLKLCPTRANNSPRVLLPELQRHVNSVRWSRYARRTHIKLTQTLILRLLKTHMFFLLFPKLEKHGPLCAIQCSIFIPFIPLFQVGGPQHGNLIASAFTLLRSGHLLDFLSFLFCRKSLICLKGKAMSPRWGNTVLCSSSLQLPRLCLRPLKGLFS